MPEDKPTIYEAWGAERNTLQLVDEVLASIAKSTPDERVKHILDKAAQHMAHQVLRYRAMFQNERTRRVIAGLPSDYESIAHDLLEKAAFNPLNAENDENENKGLYYPYTPGTMTVDLKEPFPTDVTQDFLRRLRVFTNGEKIAELRRDKNRITPSGSWNMQLPVGALMDARVSIFGNIGASYGTYRLVFILPHEAASNVLMASPLYPQPRV